MIPALVTTLIIIVSCIAGILTPVVFGGTRTPPTRKISKAEQLNLAIETTTVRAAEAGYNSDDGYVIPNGLYLHGDELHTWIELRTDDNPYQVQHAWKDCQKCITDRTSRAKQIYGKPPPEIAAGETPKPVSEKTPAIFPENVWEKIWGDVPEKTSGKLSGEDLVKIQEHVAEKTSRREAEKKWVKKSAKVRRENVGGDPLEKGMATLDAAIAEMSRMFDPPKTPPPVVDRCSANGLHEAHEWFAAPWTGRDPYLVRRCPGNRRD